MNNSLDITIEKTRKTARVLMVIALLAFIIGMFVSCNYQNYGENMIKAKVVNKDTKTTTNASGTTQYQTTFSITVESKSPKGLDWVSMAVTVKTSGGRTIATINVNATQLYIEGKGVTTIYPTLVTSNPNKTDEMDIHLSSFGQLRFEIVIMKAAFLDGTIKTFHY